MNKVNSKKLLKSRLVQEEIARHRWLESEKIGYDIGFEQAAEDWISRFSEAWIEHHMPKTTPGKSRKAR